MTKVESSPNFTLPHQSGPSKFQSNGQIGGMACTADFCFLDTRFMWKQNAFLPWPAQGRRLASQYRGAVVGSIDRVRPLVGCDAIRGE